MRWRILPPLLRVRGDLLAGALSSLHTSNRTSGWSLCHAKDSSNTTGQCPLNPTLHSRPTLEGWLWCGCLLKRSLLRLLCLLLEVEAELLQVVVGQAVVSVCTEALQLVLSELVHLVQFQQLGLSICRKESRNLFQPSW